MEDEDTCAEEARGEKEARQTHEYIKALDTRVHVVQVSTHVEEEGKQNQPVPGVSEVLSH